jgi:hypothetical protein
VPLLGGGALEVNTGPGIPSAETYTPTPAKCSPTQVTRASLFENMAPQRVARTLARLLSGGYHLVAHTARPGAVRVNWYTTTLTAEGSNRVLLADGGARSNGQRPVQITVRLSREGEQVLAPEMHIQAQGIFAASGAKTLMVTRAFVLKEQHCLRSYFVC